MKLKDKFCNFLNGLVDSRLNNTKKGHDFICCSFSCFKYFRSIYLFMVHNKRYGNY